MPKPQYTEEDVKTLMDAALQINDKLSLKEDHATFEGSMNDVEHFRLIVNQFWHKYEGWHRGLIVCEHDRGQLSLLDGHCRFCKPENDCWGG